MTPRVAGVEWRVASDEEHRGTPHAAPVTHHSAFNTRHSLMHRTFGYLSKQFVEIRSGEGRKVLLTFLYFFLVITAYYIVKPVSRSLMLGELGSQLIPYGDLICAILMGPLVAVFARLVDRVTKPTLVSWSFGGVILVLLVFWRLLALPMPWIAGLFYIWVSVFSVLVCLFSFFR